MLSVLYFPKGDKKAMKYEITQNPITSRYYVGYKDKQGNWHDLFFDGFTSLADAENFRNKIIKEGNES